MPRVSFREASFRYRGGDSPIFENFSLDIAATTESGGKIIGVVGGSGEGKSTLLRLIAGLEKPNAGEVVVDPREPWEVGYLPQVPVMLEHFGVKRNARLLGELAQSRDRFSERTFSTSAALLGVENHLLDRTDTKSLSGGEKQRIALLRLVSVRPKILLLDEPCAGLDWAVKGRFLEQLGELVWEHPMMVLYVTHNWSELEPVAKEVLYIERVGRSPARTYRCSLEDFSLRPPTVKAARIVSEGPMNVIKVSVRGQELSLAQNGSRLPFGVLEEPSPEGEYLAGFGPIDIHVTGKGDGEIRRVGSGGAASLIRIQLDGQPLNLWVGRCFERAESLRMVGEICLFDQNENWISSNRLC